MFLSLDFEKGIVSRFRGLDGVGLSTWRDGIGYDAS